MSNLSAESMDVDSMFLSASRAAMFARSSGEFLDWMCQHLRSLVPDMLRASPGSRVHLADALGLSIWNALPINARGRIPRRVPHDAIPRCLYFRNDLLRLRPRDLWPYVLANLPERRREQLMKRFSLSGEVALACTEILMNQQVWAEAVEFSESCLAAPECFHDVYAAALLESFCLAGERLEWSDRVRGVLLHVIARAPVSPLRSCARICLGIDYFLVGSAAPAREIVLELQSDAEGTSILNMLEALLGECRCGASRSCRNYLRDSTSEFTN